MKTQTKNPLQMIIENLIAEACAQATAADDKTHSALQAFQCECLEAWQRFNMKTKGVF